MNSKMALIFCGLFLGFSFASAQTICINEVMSSNENTISDEDGDFPDWIELYNAGTQVIDLDGYGLTDDADDLQKWTFPSLRLNSHQFLLIFASDKDRTTPQFWDTIIDWGDLWRYHVGSAEVPSNWRSLSFDASGWLEGPSGFGYGDNDDSTEINPGISLFIRKTFAVDQPELVSGAMLHIDYDDGFVAYLNGQELARSNLGTPGSSVPYTQTADAPREAEMYQGGNPEAFSIALNDLPLVEGENVLAIQVHNVSATSSDLSAIPFFSLQYSSIPDHQLHISSFLSLPIGGLHTNFKISAGGESLYLSDPTATIVDSFPADSLPTDISKGRSPDGAGTWKYFTTPTPGETNDTSGYSGMAGIPDFSLAGGFYSDAVSVTLTSPDQGAVIRYSLDGSPPDSTSSEYSEPLNLQQTTVIRARIYKTGYIPGRVVTQTYFINEQTTLPVISLAIKPSDLWDDETGIYVLGNDYEPDNPYFGANFWQDWERRAHLEFYEPDGSLGWSSDAGIKIFGSYSRALPQKSLAVFFRGEYGRTSLDYQLFPTENIHEFGSFVLRNSANDWDHSMMRDATLQGLVSRLDLDDQAYRPCILFINGEYWGIHNIREKLNEEYLASHHGIDPDNVDMLEGNAAVVEGDAGHYNALINFINSHTLADSANFAYVESQMEVENFIDYETSEIYFDNRDWPGNNIKFWRPKTPEGKWRWLLYDTDFGFSLYEKDAYQYNTLEFALADDGPSWPNPPWSTLLLRKLMQNPEFQHRFINRFADHLNTSFQPDTVIAQINQNQSVIAPEIERHYLRWSQPIWWCQTNLWWSSLDPWFADIQHMRTFALNRHVYVRAHILQHFGLPGTYNLHTSVSPIGGGSVQINTVIPENYPWDGMYFQTVPVEVRAIPTAGYRFKGWVNHPDWSQPTVSINPNGDFSIEAEFVRDSTQTSTVVINEINYNSNDDHDSEDWVELYNPGDADLDISGWIFSDEDDDHQFIFPEYTILYGRSYLVICMDSTLFRSYFPDVHPLLGNVSFGLSGGGELVRIFNRDGEIVDSLTYDDNEPWPPAADGDGPTLELVNPSLDNGVPENWRSSNDYGTPGEQNSAYEPVKVTDEKNLPTEFVLLQNYPNPFNPSTRIQYRLPDQVRVTIWVYNMLGQEITTLVDEIQPAGDYSVEWAGQNYYGQKVASGIYIVRMDAGNYHQHLKMVLLR